MCPTCVALRRFSFDISAAEGFTTALQHFFAPYFDGHEIDDNGNAMLPSKVRI